MKPSKVFTEGLTLETIASKLTYFQEQIHLLHWQTNSYAEHKTLGSLYEYIHEGLYFILVKHSVQPARNSGGCLVLIGTTVPYLLILSIHAVPILYIWCSKSVIQK